MYTNILKGKIFEAKAVNYLKTQGYQILQQNYKNKIGEIDIIATHENYLVFVEVKYRTSARFGMPAEAVTRHKINKIRLIATYYLQSKKLLNNNVRFDVVEILNDKINLIQNAF